MKYTIVKDYGWERRRQIKAMYVPLSHPPGEGKCDFTEAPVPTGGVGHHLKELKLPSFFREYRKMAA